MAGLGDVYSSEWWNKYQLGKGWVPNWPLAPVTLGQRLGSIKGHLEYRGSATDFGVRVVPDVPVKDQEGGAWTFSSSGVTNVEVGVDASLPGWEWLGDASAGFKIACSKANALYLSAEGLFYEHVKNVDSLKEQLRTVAADNGMPYGQSIVVGRQFAKQAVVVSAEQSGGEVNARVDAKLKLPAGGLPSLSSAAGHLSIAKRTGGVFTQDFPKQVTTAYQVVTLQRTGWLWWRKTTVSGLRPGDDEGDYFVRF